MTEEVRPPTGGSATHEADPTDAHDASAVSVLDTGGNFAGTEVEAVLAEIWAGITAGGIPATIFDAAGDLIVASAADTAVRLPVGTALHHLRVNAAGTGLEYAAEAGGGAEAWEDVVADLSGIVHRWKFEEASGGSVNDEISTLDLTLTGSVAYSVASPLGDAISMTGGYAESTGLGSIPVGDAARTIIAVWRQTTKAAIASNFVVFSYGAAVARQLFQVFTGLTVGMTFSLVTDTVSMTGVVGDGRWHMAAGVHGGARATFGYYDGQFYGMATGAAMATSSANNFHVGAEYDDTDPSLITVSDVIVFDRMLSVQELDRLWDALRALL